MQIERDGSFIFSHRRRVDVQVVPSFAATGNVGVREQGHAREGSLAGARE